MKFKCDIGIRMDIGIDIDIGFDIGINIDIGISISIDISIGINIRICLCVFDFFILFFLNDLSLYDLISIVILVNKLSILITIIS